jgi:KTSC domain
VSGNLPQAHGFGPNASAAGPFLESAVSLGYDPRSRTLEIEFHRTGIYQYYDVPRAVLEEMLAQNSLGAYFNMEIRDIYRCVRVR